MYDSQVGQKEEVVDSVKIKDGKPVNLKLTDEDLKNADLVREKFSLTSRCAAIRLSLKVAAGANLKLS